MGPEFLSDRHYPSSEPMGTSRMERCVRKGADGDIHRFMEIPSIMLVTWHAVIVVPSEVASGQKILNKNGSHPNYSTTIVLITPNNKPIPPQTENTVLCRSIPGMVAPAISQNYKTLE